MATRANVEVILVKRLSGLMAKAGLAVTFAGSNADLNDPIGWALRQLDYSVADITSVTSAEVAEVASTDLDQLLDLAEFRTLENILGNLNNVDVTLGPRSERLFQLVKQVQDRIDRLSTKLADLYGFSTPTLETGLITYEFADHSAEVD